MAQVGYARIGDVLLTRGLITQDQLDVALKEQQATGRRLGDTLLARGWVSSSDLVDVISERLGLPKLSIKGLAADPEVVNIIPLPTAKKHRVVPLFKIGNRLTVAMADPLDMVAIDEVRYRTGLLVNRVVATPEDIESAITQFYTVAESVERAIHDVPVAGSAAAEDAPVVRLVDVLLTEAIKQRSSDLHIEPDEGTLRIRFRVDGVLREEAQPPAQLQPAIVSRIKVLAGMDVSEKRIPQDGRFAMNTAGSAVDLRVSTIPTIHGEKVVIRILARQNAQLSLASIGLSQSQETLLRSELNASGGMILISGPTSSGKTTTLYAALGTLNNPEHKLVTLEDPIEYQIAGINQVQINVRAGLTFASALRSILRSDPDVVMVGEIRDVETAKISVESALTGHFVLSTLHTNDAPSALTRLNEMGVEPFLTGAAVTAVLAQRLARKLCSHCCEMYMPRTEELYEARFTPEQVAAADGIALYRKRGCPRCNQTGYKGRIGVYQLMPMTEELSRLSSQRASRDEIERAAMGAGMKTRWDDGLAKAVSGLTSIEELGRVLV